MARASAAQHCASQQAHARLALLAKHILPTDPIFQSRSVGSATISRRSPSKLSASASLKDTLRRIIPAKRALLKDLKTIHGKHKIGDVTIANAVGGMRGLKSMVWEGSSLDPEAGIRFQGYSIADCQRLLPRGKTGREMLPEGMFWLLLTGEIPSADQVRQLSRDLAQQAALPTFLVEMLDRFPKNMHPMTQFSCAVSALNHTSKFAKAYEESAFVSKSDYWDPTFDDAISLLAKLPVIAAKIFQNTYRGGGDLPASIDEDQDWSHKFAAMLGRGGSTANDIGFQDLLRLYIALHGDHEGGNVSAHATHLVGSALSDVFLSYSAGLQGLAGPLHGLAAQEVLRFLLQMQQSLGTQQDSNGIKQDQIKAYLQATLDKGQVIPGYGHAVLRRPDPRFTALKVFGSSLASESPLYNLMLQTSEVAPKLLLEHGKTANPHPNVDCASGALFWHFGMKETMFYTAIFGVSRGLGPLAQLIWDRALGLPIERPKSVTLATLATMASCD